MRIIEPNFGIDLQGLRAAGFTICGMQEIGGITRNRGASERRHDKRIYPRFLDREMGIGNRVTGWKEDQKRYATTRRKNVYVKKVV